LKKRVLSLIIRIALSILILGLGAIAALVVGESRGLALADLSDAPVQALSATARGDILYAKLGDGLSPAGIYRSDDSGRTWQMIGSGPDRPVEALAVHPINDRVLYAGAAGGPMATTDNLWRSDDSGRSWHKFNLNLPASPAEVIPAVTALVIDPQQPEALYVGTAGQGVYRFDEQRLGYELLGGVSFYNGHVKGLAVGPDSRVYALTNEGLLGLDGDNWQKLDALPEMAVSLAVAASDPQTLYAGSPSGGAYRSSDGGQTWHSISNGLGLTPGAALRVTALAVDEHSAQHLVASTAYGLGSRLAGGGIYESHDGGRQWIKLGDTENLVTSLLINERGIYATTPRGLIYYGEPIEPAPVIPWLDLGRLAHPTGTRLFILVFAIGLTGLVLSSWLERVIERRLGKA
jgi:photosystem II stability/assembly factor-like uncharacterized protein